jgi:hypothetical protein
MTWALRLVFLMIAVSGTAGADPMQDVLAVDDARTAALIAADRPALDRTLARELRYVHSNGLTQDRAAYLDAAVGGAMQYRVIKPLERQARPVSETVVLVTGSNHVEVVLNGKPLQADVLYTAVYVQEGGGWKMTAWQSTPAPASK